MSSPPFTPREPADVAKQYGLTVQEITTLAEKTVEVKGRAYCPYSLFHVGCTLLIRSPKHEASASSPSYISGANVENAAYPVGTCAERVAMGTAVVQGYKRGDFKAVAVATDITPPASPCGMCRQFLREFVEDHVPILMFDKDGNMDVKTLGELLPLSFGPEALPPREKMADINKS